MLRRYWPPTDASDFVVIDRKNPWRSPKGAHRQASVDVLHQQQTVGECICLIEMVFSLKIHKDVTANRAKCAFSGHVSYILYLFCISRLAFQKVLSYPFLFIGGYSAFVSLQAELGKINAFLCTEYECRRRMLIKRLDVTVQSFSWSERAKVGET